MNNPGRVSTKGGLVDTLYRQAPSRACQHAIREGRTLVLGGFASIPPYDSPGWLCCVRSRHGRAWLLAVIPNEEYHSLGVFQVDAVPWDQWIGRQDRKTWSPYDGDSPKDAARWRLLFKKGDFEMKLAEVPAYIEAKFGVHRIRQTVYNWATKGVVIAGETYKLRTERRVGQMFTRSEWVDDFLARLDAR